MWRPRWGGEKGRRGGGEVEEEKRGRRKEGLSALKDLVSRIPVLSPSFLPKRKRFCEKVPIPVPYLS